MKTKFRILLLFVLCVFCSNIQGQDLQLAVIATPPHPSLLSEFAGATNNYRVNIVNLNQDQGYDIILQGRLTSDNGISAELEEDYDDYEIINIPAASSQMFTFEELGDYFDGFSLDDINYSGGPDVDYLIQSQRLPDGVYSVCMEAREFDSRVLLSLPMEANCSNPIIIQSINPPTIVVPTNGELIDQVDPTFFNISWTPVVAPSASIVYDLVIAEYSDLVNEYDAIEDANFIQFEERDLRANVFSYNQTHTPLEVGRQYIARVRARDENKSVNIFNSGWSDIVVFTFGEVDLGDDNGQNQQGEGDYSCMAPCTAIDIPNVPAIPSISIGDIFKIGHFNLQIDDYQQTISGYSGRGVIKASDFFPRDINVAFEDVQINERNMITDGAVRGLRKAAARAFPRVDEALGASEIDEMLVDRMYNEILDPAAEMISDDINESLDEIGEAFSLPISFGQGEYKIHIPDMTFTAQGATVSMLTGYELEGDYLEGSKKLVFGSPEICITPGGLSLTDDILKLDILTPIDYSPSEVFDLHINGSEGANPSYISIDCDGLNEIELNGHVAYSRDYLLAVNEQGDVERNKKFATSFSANFTDWDEMLFETHNNLQGEQGGLYFSPTFEVQQLPDFKFNFERMVIDLSESNDVEGMVFPAIQEANWTGTFIKNLQLQLPDYFEKGADAISLEMSDLLIDNSGVSFNFIGSNLEELTDLSFGGWGVNVSSLNIRMFRNLLVNSSIRGDIDLPICEEPIGLAGTMQKQESQMDFSFRFDVREKWEVPMWACKFQCSQNSRLVTELDDGEFVLKAILSGDLELNESIADFDQIKIDRVRFEGMELSTSAPYFQPGNFAIDAVVRAELLGFNISVEDIDVSQVEMPNVQGKLPKLSFDLGFKFGSKGADAGGMYLSTDTKLNITGKRNRNTGKFTFDGVNLERIELKSNVASVSLDGYLDIYRNHNIYGDGFGGGLKATFIGMGRSIDADVIFGNVDNYDYWFVNAGAVMPGGVPLGPIQIKGLSGGAFYNMNQSINYNTPVGQGAATYLPQRGGWGFSAGTVWATVGAENVFNGNVNLVVDFQPSGALNVVTLDGRAKMMSDPSFSRNEIGNTEMLFDGLVSYNHRRGSLNGSFGYRLDIPRGYGIINGGDLGTRNVSFNIDSPNDWNFNLGNPVPNGSLDEMLGFNLNLGIKIKKKNVGIETGFKGYFNIGTSTPPMPPLPPRAQAVVGNDFGSLTPRRPGLATGLHVAFETGKIKFGYDIAGLEISAYAGLGYDLSFQHMYGMLCNGREEFGIGNWYMQGQAYVYAGGELNALVFGGTYNILSASVGAKLTLTGPDPYFVSGRLRLRGKIPFVGWKTMYLGVSAGERCEFTADPNQGDEFLNELAEVSILSELDGVPTEDVDFTESNTKIRADFFKKPMKANYERFSDGSFIDYKIYHKIEIYKLVNGNWRREARTDEIRQLKFPDGRVDFYINSDNDHQRILSPGRDYKLIVSGTLKYRTSYGDPYVVGVDLDDNPLTVTREHYFSTTELEDFTLDVLEISPAPSQLYYHLEDAESNQGFLRMSNENLQMLHRLGYGVNANLKFRFTEYEEWTRSVKTGVVLESTGYYRAGDLNEYFDISRLNDDKVYLLEVFLAYENEEWVQLYRQFFGTSRFSKLQRKLENMRVDRVEVSGDCPSGSRYTINITCEEELQKPFENIHARYLTNKRQAWDIKREKIERFASERGFLNLVQLISPELVELPLEGGGNSPINLLPGPFGLNLNPFANSGNPSNPTVLKYEWRPDDYIVALRNYAVQNHFGEIFGNAELSSLFFSDYVPFDASEFSIDPLLLLTDNGVGASHNVVLNF